MAVFSSYVMILLGYKEIMARGEDKNDMSLFRQFMWGVCLVSRPSLLFVFLR